MSTPRIALTSFLSVGFWRERLAGLLVAALIGLIAGLIAQQIGGPVMLLALLLGMALNVFGRMPKTASGMVFSSKGVLKFGVALLGARIGAEDIISLGLEPLLLVLVGVIATLGFGAWLGRLMGLGAERGILTGGATAICGASAALAIAAALPNREWKERETAFTIVAVTTLSTIAMVLYPIITGLLGFNDHHAGIFLGGSIHDVAQVVGAGGTISEEALQSSTLTKLFRVALLAPVVLAVAMIFRERNADQKGGLKGLTPPPMLIGFILLAALNSFGLLPAAFVTLATTISTACLVIAVAAIGARTQLADLRALGWKPMALVTAETIVLGAITLLGVAFLL